MLKKNAIFAILLVVGLVAASCGSGSGTSANDTSGSDDTGSDDATEESSDAEPVEFDGTIKLGAALSATGKFAVEGEDSQRGYDTWVEWVNNERGGIKVGDKTYNVEIVYYDDESDADTAANLTTKLIDEDEVDFLLGPYSSGLTVGASAIAEKNNIIMVEGNGTANSMFERGFKNLFLVATIGSDYTKTGIEEMAEGGAKTAVIAYEDTAFPTAVAEGAEEHLEANGIEVLAVEKYPKDIQDVSAIMTKFRGLEPDIFVGGGHYNDAVLFVNSAKELGWDPDGMLITVGPSNPRLAEELGEDLDGVTGPTQWEATMAYKGEYFGSAAEYAEYFQELHGVPPVYQAASATASALALQIAIEDAGDLETDAVRTALLEMEADTFYGPIDFDERGVNIAKPMGTIQVQDGEINVIAPSEAKIADLTYPIS